MKEFILTSTITRVDKTLKERWLSFFTNSSFPNNKYVAFNHMLLVAVYLDHKLGTFSSYNNKHKEDQQGNQPQAPGV